MSFRKYLQEAWKFAQNEKGKKSSERAEHYSTVDGHRVNIIMTHMGGRSYDADFTVNGHVSKRRPVDPAVGKKILQHVNTQVDRFVRHVKPKELGFSSLKPLTPRYTAQDQIDHAAAKTRVYTQVAKRMAKKHGGTAQTTDMEDLGYYNHTVKFKR